MTDHRLHQVVSNNLLFPCLFARRCLFYFTTTCISWNDTYSLLDRPSLIFFATLLILIRKKGPCGGDPCFESDHCRSRYGFCGPGEHYCTDTAIWSSDCPDPTRRPTRSPVKSTPSPVKLTPSPSGTPSGPRPPSDVGLANVVTANPTLALPVPVPVVVKFEKPKGGKGKPSKGKGGPAPSGGGKGGAVSSSATKPTGSEPGAGPFVPVFQTMEPPTSEPTERATTTPPTRMPITKQPTRMPTVQPTSRPTQRLESFLNVRSPTQHPTHMPTEGQGPNYVVLETYQSDLVVITNAPTPRPTPHPTPRPTPHPTRASVAIQAQSASMAGTPSQTSTVENNPPADRDVVTIPDAPPASVAVKGEGTDGGSCTADPCEVVSWCRSRYGSCGPGFIYCNAGSTWKSSCPPMAPRPTRTPTPRPTRDPVTIGPAFGAYLDGKASADGGVASAPSEAPAWSALPGPTLPVIEGASSLADFASQSHVHSAYGAAKISSDEEGGDLPADDDDDRLESSEGVRGAEGPEEDGGSSASGDDGGAKKESPSDEYAGVGQWLDFAEGRSGASGGGTPLGAIVFAAAWSLFSWMST